jgi:hypothetical protein
MPRQFNPSQLIALGCVVLAAGLLLPPRAFAEPLARPTPLLDAAVRAAAAREAGPMRERRAAQAPAAPSADLRSGSFFKSKAGVATLVIFGAGVGYALYSSSNDRIRSTGR